MPKTRSPACRPWSPAGTRSATPAKSMPATNGYGEAAVRRPRRLLSSGLTPANRTRMSTASSAAGTGRSWTDGGSPNLWTANVRILASRTGASGSGTGWLLVYRRLVDLLDRRLELGVELLVGLAFCQPFEKRAGEAGDEGGMAGEQGA